MRHVKKRIFKFLIVQVIIFPTLFLLVSTLLAGEPLCGIGKDSTSNGKKETYQQQTNPLGNLPNNIMNALSGAVRGAATGALGSITGSGNAGAGSTTSGGTTGTRVSNKTIQELFSLLNTLNDFNKVTIAQGYICIPQKDYNQIKDNLTNILLELY
jgi:hypothetical protein